MMSAGLNAIRGALAGLQSTLSTVSSTATTTSDDGTIIRKRLNVAGVEDGGQLQIGGLKPDAFYEVWAVKSTPATTTGLSTDRQRAIYDQAGASAEDLAWEEAAAVALADAVTTPLSPRPLARADTNGRLYLVYAVTPAAGGNDIAETVTVDLLPRRTP